MPYIHPEALSACRARRNLTQQQLADEAEVSKKQIGRLEKGTRLTNANAATVKRLAQALGVEEAALAKGPNWGDQKKKKRKPLPPGYKRVYIYADDKDRLLYQFLRDRYGVEPHSILSAAPLLFLVVAEWSLAERKEKLEALEQTLKSYRNAPDQGFSHHLDHVQAGLGRLAKGTWAERRSLEARDLSGKTFDDDEWSEGYEGAGDLFVDFLAQKVRDLGPDVFDADWGDEISGSLSQIDVSLFNSEIERLTNGDGLAKLALARHVRPTDIPAELLGEEKTAERVAWLQAQCSPETQREHEEFRAMVDSVDLETLDI